MTEFRKILSEVICSFTLVFFGTLSVVVTLLTLENNPIVDFIGTWHLAEDINAGFYTK